MGRRYTQAEVAAIIEGVAGGLAKVQARRLARLRRQLAQARADAVILAAENVLATAVARTLPGEDPRDQRNQH